MDLTSYTKGLPYGTSVTAEILEPGKTLGDYEIHRLVSVSLFGGFYRVREIESGLFYCLQTMPSAVAKDPQFVAGVKATVDKLAELDNPFLLRPVSVVTLENSFGVLYEDFECLSLFEYVVSREGSEGIPVEEARVVLSGVSRAMQCAHENGIGHLVLSPDYVVVGIDGRVKVFGFGLFTSMDRKRFEIFVSSAIVPVQGDARPTAFSTLDVLSPELRNDDKVDFRSDVYSFGICTVFALLGKRPDLDGFQITEVRAGISEGWDVLLGRCLHEIPTHRYQTFAEVTEALEKVESLHKAKQKEERPRPSRASGKGRMPFSLESLRRAGDSKGKLLHLAILGALGLAVVGAAAYFIPAIVDELMPQEEGRQVVRVAPGEKASLVVETVPEMANVRVFGQLDADFLVTQGSLRLRMRSGEYTLVVSAPNHREIRRNVTVGASMSVERFELPVDWGRVVIVAPPGAEIYAGEVGSPLSYLDSVPQSGELAIAERLFARVYRFEIRKAGYETIVVEDVDLRSDAVRLEVEMTALPSSLTVKSQPAGATVVVNGRTMGVTPLELEGLPGDTVVRVAVEGTGVQRREREVLLEPGGHNEVDFGDLDLIMGVFRLKVLLEGRPAVGESEDGVRIRIGSREFSGTGRLDISLQEGEYELLVGHKDYLVDRQSIRISQAEATEQVVNLEARPCRLQIVVPEDKSTVLTVDGEQASPRDGVYSVPAERPVVLKLYVRDYLTLTREVQFPANADQTWVPELKRIQPPRDGADWIVPYLGIPFKWIEGGSYVMGSPLEEPLRLPNEGPLTRVRVSRGFWVGEFEIRQREFQRIMGENPSSFVGELRPVDSVTWTDAIRFCNRLNEIERQQGRLPSGYEYRLPNEAEWEYFARAGTRTAFHFGDSADQTDGNFKGRYPPRHGSTAIETEDRYGTVECGSFEPNAWGIFDCHGNVGEWTLNRHSDRLPGDSISSTATQSGDSRRVVRGGAWSDFAHRSRSAARDKASSSSVRDSLGFRLVLAPQLDWAAE